MYKSNSLKRIFIYHYNQRKDREKIVVLNQDIFAHLLITVIFETCYVEISRSCDQIADKCIMYTKRTHTKLLIIEFFYLFLHINFLCVFNTEDTRNFSFYRASFVLWYLSHSATFFSRFSLFTIGTL